MIQALRERLLPAIKELEQEINRILASDDTVDRSAELGSEIARLDESIKNRITNAPRMALDKELLQYVTGLIIQERSRLRECRDALAAVQRATKRLTFNTELVQDAIQNLETVLETGIDLAREFLAGIVTSIVVRPLPTTPERPQGIRCPLCGVSVKRLTPQHAALHGLGVEEMAAAHPEFGVGQPVEVRILLNMKDLLPKEEVVHILVAGAGFEPATFGL